MNEAASIRRAVRAEAGRLTEIALASKRHWDYPVAWIEGWRDALTFTPGFVSSHPVYVAVEADDAPIACYALVGAGAAVQLEHFWVEPSRIGRGIGRALFAHAARTARERGAARLVIDSDPNAAAFYEKLGAARIGSLRADVCGARRQLPQLRVDLRTL